MTLQDRSAEIVLAIFDLFMNIVTLGYWGRVNGEVRPEIKVKMGRGGM